MKLTLSLATGLALLSAALGAPSTAGLQSTQCGGSVDTSKNYYKTESTLKYASLFNIEYHDYYKVITTNSSDIYVLYQCGADKPSVKGATSYFSVPISSTAAWSTTAAIYLEALGVQDRIKNLGTAPSMVSACLQRLLEDDIKPFQESNTTETDNQQKQNDVVFDIPGMSDPKNNTVYSAEYLESSALGRAEWLKFFGAFFNAEERANDIFDSIEANYNCFAKKASDEYNDIRPVIAWASYAPPNKFNNNTAYWQISYADYKYDIVRDAGARMLNTTGPAATKFASAKAFLDALEDVDILIDESMTSFEYDELLKKYGVTDVSEYPWAENKRVYRPDKIQSRAGGLGWFEAPLVFADALLQDIVGIAHPKFLKDGYDLVWFRNLATNDSVTVVSAKDCKDEFAIREDPAGSCSSINFEEANTADSAYEDVDANETQDLIYDLSKSDVINDDNDDDKDSAAHLVSFAAISALVAVIAAAI